MNKQLNHVPEATADVRTPASAAGTTILDSFHWDLHESAGVLVLGLVVFALLYELKRTYQRLLEAYQVRYMPEAAY